MPTAHAATYATNRSRASALPALARGTAAAAFSSVSKRLLRGTLADPASDLCDDHTWLDGLGEIGAEPNLRSALTIVGESMRRQRDDGDRTRTRVVAQNAGGLPTVHPWNRDVHQ